MTKANGQHDSALDALVALKRQLTSLKLDALLDTDRVTPTPSIHDLDSIVDEVVSGVQEQRHARSAVPHDQAQAVPPIRDVEGYQTSSSGYGPHSPRMS